MANNYQQTAFTFKLGSAAHVAEVVSWVWVTNEDAGIESEDEEDKVDGV